ncbi:MAG: hypothetical protein N3D77_16470, partial [Geminicoccaceae bacterium]|nr:hypothetical protein [Geminicoccaceae bacterium]
VNIAVDGVFESEVRLSDAADFTAKSLTGDIYVSCDADGAVGHPQAARAAFARLGQRAFYGGIIQNCHHFSAACLRATGRQAQARRGLVDTVGDFVGDFFDLPEEPTFAALKRAARRHLGATKWKLWDWRGEDDEEDAPPPEPDWAAQERFFRQLALTPETAAWILSL